MSETKSLSAKYQDVLIDLIARRDQARLDWEALDRTVNALTRYAVTSSADAVPAGLATLPGSEPAGVLTHEPQFPLRRGDTIIKASPRAIEQPTVKCAIVPQEPADLTANGKPRNAKAQEMIVARKRAGLTQSEVANAAGVSLMTVSRMEKGLHVSPHTRARVVGAIPSAEPKHESGPQCTGERACPRPIVPGQSMCKAHLDMFEQPIRFNSTLHQ